MTSTAEARKTGIDPIAKPTGLQRGVLAINATVAWPRSVYP